MPHVAGTATNLESGVTNELVNKVKERQAAGADVIDMGAGDPDFDTPDYIREAAKRALDEGETHYTHISGIPELRNVVARKLREDNGIEATADDILVTPGSKYAVYETIQALVGDGDEVAVLSPAYPNYAPMIRMAGGRIKYVSLDPNTGFALGDTDLEAELSPETHLLVLNTPSNPTGAVFSQADLERIRDLAVDYDFWVVADEIYEEIIYGATHHSIGRLDGMRDRTVTINGFSKTWAMTGWRIGYLTAPNRVMEPVKRIHANSVTNATNFAQHGAIAAMSSDRERVQEMVKTYRTRRDLVVDLLSDAGIDVPAPQGALYAFVPVGGSNDVDLCHTLVEEADVAVSPGSAYETPGYIRISFTVDRDQLTEGIRRIAEYV